MKQNNFSHGKPADIYKTTVQNRLQTSRNL